MSLLLSHLLQGDRLSEISPKKLLQALGLNSAAVDVEMAQTFLSPEHSLRQITNGIALADMSLEIHKEYIRSCRLLTRELHLQSGEQYIIVNGRVSIIAFRVFIKSLIFGDRLWAQLVLVNLWQRTSKHCKLMSSANEQALL